MLYDYSNNTGAAQRGTGQYRRTTAVDLRHRIAKVASYFTGMFTERFSLPIRHMDTRDERDFHSRSLPLAPVQLNLQ